MVFCSKCGNESPDGTTFCSRCGTRLNLQGSNGVASPGAGAPPSPPGTYTPAPMGYQGPAGPKRNTVPIIIVALIIGCIAITSLALLIVPPGDSDGTTDGTTDDAEIIRDGDYADYKLTVKNGTQSYIGTCRIIYTNVTETSLTMTVTMSINGHTTTNSETIDMSGGSTAGESLGDTSSEDSASTSTIIGNETISTALGLEVCTHARTVTSDYVEDNWFGQKCPIKLTRTYTDGSQMTLEISGTNMSSL